MKTEIEFLKEAINDSYFWRDRITPLNQHFEKLLLKIQERIKELELREVNKRGTNNG